MAISILLDREFRAKCAKTREDAKRFLNSKAAHAAHRKATCCKLPSRVSFPQEAPRQCTPNEARAVSLRNSSHDNDPACPLTCTGLSLDEARAPDQATAAENHNPERCSRIRPGTAQT